MAVPRWSHAARANPTRLVTGAVLSLAALTACGTDSAPTAPRPDATPLAAKGGGASTAPSVTAASPSQAPSDTTLDVTVYGTGFSTGARAAWSLAGDTTQVQVLSTRVVNSKQLVARVAIPATATAASYDIVVTLADGKKGVGAELFQVTDANAPASFAFPNDPTLGVYGDGLFVEAGASIYSSDSCGVSGTIFVGGSGDATMNIQGAASGKGKCTRALYIAYGDGRIDRHAAFVNLNVVHGPTFTIPIGASVTRGLNLADARCGGLRWKARLNDGTVTGADSVVVTRESSDTWLVTTQPYPNDRAYCVAEERTYHVSLRFRLKAGWPLP